MCVGKGWPPEKMWQNVNHHCNFAEDGTFQHIQVPPPRLGAFPAGLPKVKVTRQQPCPHPHTEDTQNTNGSHMTLMLGWGLGHAAHELTAPRPLQAAPASRRLATVTPA